MTRLLGLHSKYCILLVANLDFVSSHLDWPSVIAVLTQDYTYGEYIYPYLVKNIGFFTYTCPQYLTTSDILLWSICGEPEIQLLHYYQRKCFHDSF